MYIVHFSLQNYNFRELQFIIITFPYHDTFSSQNGNAFRNYSVRVRFVIKKYQSYDIKYDFIYGFKMKAVAWRAKFPKLLCMGTQCATKVWNLWTHIYYRYFRYLWIITWFSYYSFIDWRHFPQDANIMWSSREKLDDVGIFIMYYLENHFVPPKNHKGNWCH